MSREKALNDIAPSQDVEREGGEGRLYAVPALEKGLDVLEFLASQAEPIGLSALAQRLGRSPGELFRILAVLTRRGWLVRTRDDSYVLSTRLFELAHEFPPTRRLIDVSLPVMRRLASTLQQSCHLSIADRGDQLVVLGVDSGGPAGVFVRSGTRYRLGSTASGRVMLAFGSPELLTRIGNHAATTVGFDRPVPSDLDERLTTIRSRGYEEVSGEWLAAVTDICWPIFNVRGEVTAVLAMPFLPIASMRHDVPFARERMRDGAEEISRALGAPDYQMCLEARSRKED